LEQSPPPDINVLFPQSETEFPKFVQGRSLLEYWELLSIVRNHLLDAYRDMTLEDFQRSRFSQNASCSAEWVLHECCQFEAECRAQIKTLFADAKAALDPESSEQ
jgi:hypothetical protein